MIVDVLTVGAFQVNCVILGDEGTRQAAIVDPGEEGARIVERAHALDLEIASILLTHAHVDHVSGVAAVKEATGAPILLHPGDRELYDHLPQQARAFAMSADSAPPPDGELTPGTDVRVGSLSLEVRFTPGHSPGSVSFVWRGESEDEGVVLPGDAVFAGSIGRTDLWGGDYATLIGSIKDQLLTLPGGYRVIPGHGPETTVDAEKRYNPFLSGAVRM